MEALNYVTYQENISLTLAASLYDPTDAMPQKLPT